MSGPALVSAHVAGAGAAASRSAPRRRHIPLSVKLAIALVGLVTLVLLINGAVDLWLNYEQAKYAAVAVQEEEARGAADRVAGFLAEIESQIGWTTRAEWSHVGAEQQRYDFIRLLRQAPAITEVSYLDPNGKEQLKVSRLEPDTVGGGQDYSTDPRFTQAVTNKIWFGPVYFRRGSEPYMTVAVAHAGHNPGVTVAEVNLKLVWDVITAIRVGERGYAFVVTATGRLIAHPDLSLVLRDTDLSHLPQVAQALPSPSAGGTDRRAIADAGITTDLGGRSVLSANATIDRVGWIVFVQSPVSEAMAPVYTSLVQTLALLGLGLFLATILGTFLARRMVVPIRRLQEGAERLGVGDLSERIVIHTGDEIETLADRFNTMASRVQDSHETLEHRVEERTRDLNQALQQQTATTEVLKVISRSTFRLQTVLDTLVRSAMVLCDGHRGVIYLENGDAFHLQAHTAQDEQVVRYYEDQPQTPGRGSAGGRVLLTGDIQNIPDILSDEDYDPALKDRMGAQALLGVPLMRDKAIVGAIVVARSRLGAFGQREIELVQTFADQAVIAIENGRLFEEVQARTRELTEALEHQTATSDVLSVISRSPNDLQPVLDTIVETAHDLCRAEYTLFFRLGPDGLYHLAASKNAEGSFLQWLRTHPIAKGDGTATGLAALDQATIHLPGALVDARFKARTQLAVPLMRSSSVIGVVFLARTEVAPFTERQVNLVNTFADQAVIAINNVELFEEVQARTRELSRSLEDLRAAQDRLVQSEKLASLGQLTAGIAHEIKNPLNFINNFSALSSELVDELRELLQPAGLDASTRDEVDELVGLLKANLAKVVQHGERADSIVKNMLLHSREGSGDHRVIDLNGLVEESMNLAYHGARAEKPGFNVTIEKDLDPAVGKVDLFPQEVTRVLLNLISNGFYAVTKRKARASGAFEPTMTAKTRNLGDRVEIRIRDNGTGIPDDVKAKMFNPFFTTKPAGEGTGLGLSLSHDIIVKQHCGSIDVTTELGAFTEFTIVLPRTGPGGTSAKEAR